MKYLKSPLNYVGNKYRLLPQILPLFPPHIRTFVDLFSGSCTVGINVDASNYIFNDMDDRVQGIFRALMFSDTDFVLRHIKDRIAQFDLSKTNTEGFNAFRTFYNETQFPLDLYVLGSFSYNYQLRFNSKGEFNNPHGRNRSQVSQRMLDRLVEFMSRLHRERPQILSHHFADFNYGNLDHRDFVYVDPPYLITSSYYQDTGNGRGDSAWDEEQEIMLYGVLQRLTERGVKWALNNVLEHKGRRNTLLKDFIERHRLTVHHLNHTYANASYNGKRGSSVEVLVTNY